ncbi:short-chain dehydrogenase [Thalassotalea marina]|uniref:Short-chain dehydrogenase n=2 Tax=Thalassotalea marina TaxID=1673741 RepID=A0A919EPH4_9GAMM|nr:short-chain dehydrogenase [Thalassotalea marina]
MYAKTNISESIMVLIIGASSVIAQDLIAHYCKQHQVIAVSRTINVPAGDNLTYIKSNYDEHDISTITKEIFQQYGAPALVFICLGTLHCDNYFPEKRLEDISADYLEHSQKVNFIIPALWMKNICALLPKSATTTLTTFSARVGSIEDNHLGGWYAYRASKAALNMFIQTLSIEMARRAKLVKLIAFHPGTTDSPLSKPFQARVPKDKLFSPDFVAMQLANIIDNTEYQGTAKFIDWAGKPIPW